MIGLINDAAGKEVSRGVKSAAKLGYINPRF
jgi:hypothetical protein